MTEHNPYRAPQAPVVDYIPKRHPEEYAEIGRYGGFWRRFGAMLIDAMIVSPLLLLVYFGSESSRSFYSYFAVPGILFALFYQVFLVSKFGGTPGKLMLGMRVARVDGTPVTFKGAFIRYSVVLAFAVLSAVALAMASSSIPEAEYYSMSYMEKLAALKANGVTWSPAVTLLKQLWLLVGAIVMLCNPRRRATHDFMAGTVVLRTDS